MSGIDRRRTGDDRGQSEVLGFILLTAVVVFASSMLVVYGSMAISGQEDVAAVSHAERGLDQFDARASQVALGGSSVQQVDLASLDNLGHAYTDDDGWVAVTLRPESGAPTEVVNGSLGSVFYRRGETTVAYQGGGIWRADGEGTTMLSRPEFHYTEGTLTIPVVSVDGDTGLTDRVYVRKNGTSTRAFPDRSRDLHNKLESGRVEVTVQSDYYEAWGRYFEDSTDGVVTYDHDAEAVTVVFFALPDVRKYDVGIVATSGTGELRVAGTGAYVDSYDSTQGEYAATKSLNGSMRISGDVYTTGDSRIDGDVTSGGIVNLDGSSQINGNVQWTDEPEPDATERSKISGTVTKIDGIESVDPIDSFVRAYTDRIRADADNDQTPYITDNELSVPGTTAELGPGDYYLESLNLEGDETLVLNTTDGNVRVAVRDWVNLDSGNIRVVGDGTAHVVVASEATTRAQVTGEGSKDVHFHVGKSSSVHIPGEKANRLVVFGPRHFSATVTGSNANPASFDGVIFAPAGETGTGYLYVKQGDVYGLVMTGNLTAGQYGAVHYDRGLDNTLTDDSTLSELEYLHVSVHRLLVKSA
ncbi:hypothetical protein C474_08957 [Halogeometricum pallidum JCM 14848]|uniref:DUF7305 domain-containing protein n=1 Tax=Halogeometricum pallidum JCM 14848 TaxID=1227487 RepID=M0D9M2_HALPD|nr:hypothetical protein [Halogeometricum pallidum]ELZ31417.1 hypothetical protein C474_08957 [Halogeometricum pallidum JCM 14848]